MRLHLSPPPPYPPGEKGKRKGLTCWNGWLKGNGKGEVALGQKEHNFGKGKGTKEGKARKVGGKATEYD